MYVSRAKVLVDSRREVAPFADERFVDQPCIVLSPVFAFLCAVSPPWFSSSGRCVLSKLVVVVVVIALLFFVVCCWFAAVLASDLFQGNKKGIKQKTQRGSNISTLAKENTPETRRD